MSKKDLEKNILTTWIGISSIELINFAPSFESFKVTPFLVLSPLFIVILLFLGNFKKILNCFFNGSRVNRILQLLVITILISAFFSNDVELSLKRSIYFIYVTFHSLVFAFLIFNHSQRDEILVKGAYFGILIFFIFFIGQVLTTFVLGYDIGEKYLGGFVSFKGNEYGTFAFRITGQSVDANRAGISLLLYLNFILLFDNSKLKASVFIIAVLLMITTISRSAITSFIVMFSAYSIINRGSGSGKLLKYLILTLIIGGTLGLFANSFLTSGKAKYEFDLQKTLDDRLSQKSGSSQTHFAIIEEGMAIFSSDTKVMFTGIGYGAAYTVLKDFFTTKYANFHSIYVTLLVEVGIVGFLIGMILFLFPIIKNSPFTPLLLAFSFFNIFYQLLSDPLFWFIIFLSWMSIDNKRIKVTYSLVPKSR